MFVRIANGHDVRMAQRGGDAHFASEAPSIPLIAGDLGSKHLERIDATGFDAGCAVHDAHSAATDQLIDAITGYEGAGLDRVAERVS